MTRVDIDGETYAAPFVGLLREHTPGERMKMLASIRRHGIKAHVFTYLSPAHGRAILDGLNRTYYGIELGVEIPLFCLGRMPDSVARELALSLNLDRRQLTPEEQSAARQQRVKRVARCVEEGQSYRSTAALNGISLPQLQRDLELASVSPGTLAKRRKTPAPLRAYRIAKTLAKTVAAILTGSHTSRFAAVASSHGVPLSGKDWPALLTILAVLRDVAGGAASA